MAEQFGRAFETLADFRGVSIAAINGFAMGGGLEVALACDIRIAEEQARLALPEAKVGLLPCAGGTQRLAWLVGEGWAKRMILCGERIDAATAGRIGLVEDRRDSPRTLDDEAASERAEDLPAAAMPAARFMEPGMRQPAGTLDLNELDTHVRGLLDEQRVEIRKDVLVSMETVARQTGSKLNRELDERLQLLSGRQPSGDRRSGLTLTVLIVLLFASMAWNLMLSRAPQETAVAGGNETRLAVPQQAEQAVSRLKALQTETTGLLAASWKALDWAINQSLQYPYDEIALDNQRIELVQQLLERLSAAGYRGRILLETHAGEFCLVGDQDTGFRLPATDISADQCDFVGNPVEAADLPSAHQSLAFANFINSTPLLRDTDYSLDVVAASRAEPLFDYPEKSAQTTAQAWNEVAAKNNRLVIRLEPE